MKSAKKAPRKNKSYLTPRGARFAALVAAGESKADSYRVVFGKPGLDPQSAAHRAHKISETPAVAAEISRIRAKSEVKTLLTLNDRLAILAKHAQHPVKTAADRGVSVRAVDVYSKIAEGETLNVKAEVSGPGGGPVPVAAALTTMDKIAKFRAARAGRVT